MDSPPEPVSRSSPAIAAVGDLALRLRPARLEVSDFDCLDRRSDQLFLASAVRCELGSRTFFSRTACHARSSISAALPDHCPRSRVFSHAQVSVLARCALARQILVILPGIVRSIPRLVPRRRFRELTVSRLSDSGSRRLQSSIDLALHTWIPAQIKRLRRRGKVGPGLLHELHNAQQQVFAYGSEFVEIPGQYVTDKLHVNSARRYFCEAHPSRAALNLRMAL